MAVIAWAETRFRRAAMLPLYTAASNGGNGNGNGNGLHDRGVLHAK